MTIFAVLRKPVLAAIALLLVAQVAACTTIPATGEQGFTGFMSQEDEKRIGAEEHPKIVAGFGGEYTENGLEKYITSIGNKLVKVTETPNVKFTFTVLDSDVVNAFAMPGGYVYITRGLIALAENEAEVAGVLGHEIGHITARHTAQRYSSATATNIGLSILHVLTQAAGIPTQGVDQALSTGATAALQGYSRSQESQADMLGVRYMSRAGYDPVAMKTFFEKLEANDELRSKITGQPTSEESFNFTSSHPRTSERIQHAIDLAKQSKASHPVLKRDDFLREINGMIFGDSPSQGIRHGRTFSHPDLGISFTVPKGFVLENQPTAVVAINRNGSRIIFDMDASQAAKSTRDLKKYVTYIWGKSLQLTDVEKIDVKGFEAWTGRARGQTSAGVREIRLVALRDKPGRIFRLAFITPPKELDGLKTDLERTTYSFHAMSTAEIAALKPYRIRIRTAHPTDSIDRFEHKMAIKEYPNDWFRLINRTALSDGLQSGEEIKLIGE